MIFEISVAQWVCRSRREQCPDVDQNKHERKGGWKGSTATQYEGYTVW